MRHNACGGHGRKAVGYDLGLQLKTPATIPRVELIGAQVVFPYSVDEDVALRADDTLDGQERFVLRDYSIPDEVVDREPLLATVGYVVDDRGAVRNDAYRRLAKSNGSREGTVEVLVKGMRFEQVCSLGMERNDRRRCGGK